MRLLFRLVAVLLPLLVFGTLPRAASALPGYDYCSAVDWGGDRFPDGDCDALLTVPILWRGQTTQLTLRIEADDALIQEVDGFLNERWCLQSTQQRLNTHPSTFWQVPGVPRP